MYIPANILGNLQPANTGMRSGQWRLLKFKLNYSRTHIMCLSSLTKPSLFFRYYQIHNWIRFVVFGLGTALFLAIGNLLLILSLRHSYQHRKTLLSQNKLREEKRLKVGGPIVCGLFNSLISSWRTHNYLCDCVFGSHHFLAHWRSSALCAQNILYTDSYQITVVLGSWCLVWLRIQNSGAINQRYGHRIRYSPEVFLFPGPAIEVRYASLAPQQPISQQMMRVGRHC